MSKRVAGAGTGTGSGQPRSALDEVGDEIPEFLGIAIDVSEGFSKQCRAPSDEGGLVWSLSRCAGV
jgi:hypothetical protein